MNAVFSPSFAKGTAFAPPSKSMAHRALICAALAEGESTISPVHPSQDILATIKARSALGASFSTKGETVTVLGTGGTFSHGKALFCSESGSTLRFLIPLCLLNGKEYTLTGAERLFQRPLNVYEELCDQKGFLFEKEGGALRVKGELLAGEYSVSADVSSQFITGLLLALSLLEGNSTIHLVGCVESASYLDLTLSAMASFGVLIEKTEDGFFIPGGQRYRACAYTVEGDCSNGAFLDALNLMGGEVLVTGLGEDSLQGDRIYKEYFRLLREGFCTLSLKDCPDLAPILFAVAAYFHGARFTHTGRLSIKESDRGAAMEAELRKCGARLVIEENEIVVKKGSLHRPAEPIFGHNDHRIVMAMSVLLSRLSGEIEGAEAVKKSYPDFFEVIQKLGIEVNII